jgi:hypothetical protein
MAKLAPSGELFGASSNSANEEENQRAERRDANRSKVEVTARYRAPS